VATAEAARCAAAPAAWRSSPLSAALVLGDPVAAASTQEAAGERRHVTVLFCDLVDSTGIAAKLDAEEWRDLVGAYLDAASTAVTEMGGKVISARSLRGKVESGERRCSLRSALKFKEKRDTSSLMRRMR
jgi:class 3 adenylate cyclase